MRKVVLKIINFVRTTQTYWPWEFKSIVKILLTYFVPTNASNFYPEIKIIV